jgi:hypothetical protein
MLRSLRLSATANADFQSCQRRYQLTYLHDLTQDRDKDSLRMGSNWHKVHEVLEAKAGVVCPECSRHEEIRPDCYLCGATGYVLTSPMDRVVRYLNQVYVVVPDNKTPEDWELERTILLYSLSGHHWFHSGSEDQREVIGSEIKFEVPVINPSTGRKMPKAVFVGKIDRLVRDRDTGLVYVWERKSTRRSITSTDYWDGLTQGDQISGYLYGGRYAQKCGALRAYGIGKDDTPIQGAWCDVWHKPDIKPKALSQADTKAFLESGEYCGEKFDVNMSPVSCKEGHILINGLQVPAIPGQRGFAIRETPEMYGARLLQDIASRPEHYFAQREVSRTDQELEVFQGRLFRLAKQIRAVEKGDLWVENNRACETPFYCEFRDLCRSGVEVGPDTVPVGYKKRHPRPEEIPLEEE